MSADVAVVTGAGRGIGRAVALALADRGFDVALLARTQNELDATALQVTDKGRRALVLKCDVRNSSMVSSATEATLRDLGTPRVVVCNAGVVRRSLVHETTETAWDEVVDANLKGTFLVSRAFLPSMLGARTGRVIAIASISSTLGTAKQAAYCAAKWGTVGFVKSLAEELRGTGLQTMSVMPGSVDTQMLEGSGFPPQMSAADVARLVVFAALDAPDAMNGSAVEMFGP